MSHPVFHSQLRAAIKQISECIEVRRTPAGAYDAHGRWKERVPEVTLVYAAVQPSTPKELEDLPENRRAGSSITIYSPQLLQSLSTSEARQPDRILWHGDVYEVEKVEEWCEVGGYCKAIATKVEPS